MAIISRGKERYYYALHNSQLRYAVIYVILTALTLCFLNIYAANLSRDLVFSANESAVMERVRVISSSFSELDSVTEEAAEQALLVLGPRSYDRVVVTDDAGVAVFDSLSANSEAGAQFLLPAVVRALEGYDVFYGRFVNGVVESYACVPIMYYDVPIGSVYLMVSDNAQGSLLQGLEATVMNLSIILEVIVVLISTVFSVIYARKMRRVLDSIRIVREGDYSHKVKIRSRDEMGRLATEFDALTDRLNASEQMRRRFVSDASHELKTPLASIKLLSDSILQNDMDEATVREFVGDIGNEADRLTRMSQKLLELSKLDAMAQDERELVDIQLVARKVLRMLKPQMAQRQIRLQDAMVPGCTVLIHEDDLYQIIFNLVENGIKYNHDGGLLRLSLARNENYVIFRLEDGGVGIPPQALDHIFERFYRVDKARSRMAGGSGLGLSIVHDMVLRNFGSVRVENRKEGGACFTVVFPYHSGKERER